MTIYVIDKLTNEVLETYENAIAYDPDTKTITLQAGRGTTMTQYGDDVILSEINPEERADQDIDPAEALARLEAIL